MRRSQQSYSNETQRKIQNFKLLKEGRTRLPINPCDLYVVVRQLPGPPTITVLQRKKGGDGQPVQNAVSLVFTYIEY